MGWLAAGSNTGTHDGVRYPNDVVLAQELETPPWATRRMGYDRVCRDGLTLEPHAVGFRVALFVPPVGDELGVRAARVHVEHADVGPERHADLPSHQRPRCTAVVPVTRLCASCTDSPEDSSVSL